MFRSVEDGDGDGAGVDPSAPFRRRDALDAVHADLVGEARRKALGRDDYRRGRRVHAVQSACSVELAGIDGGDFAGEQDGVATAFSGVDLDDVHEAIPIRICWDKGVQVRLLVDAVGLEPT